MVILNLRTIASILIFVLGALLAVHEFAIVGSTNGFGEEFVGGDEGGDAVEADLFFPKVKFDISFLIKILERFVIGLEIIAYLNRILLKGGAVAQLQVVKFHYLPECFRLYFYFLHKTQFVLKVLQLKASPGNSILQIPQIL